MAHIGREPLSPYGRHGPLAEPLMTRVGHVKIRRSWRRISTLWPAPEAPWLPYWQERPWRPAGPDRSGMGKPSSVSCRGCRGDGRPRRRRRSGSVAMRLHHVAAPARGRGCKPRRRPPAAPFLRPPPGRHGVPQRAVARRPASHGRPCSEAPDARGGRQPAACYLV